MALDSETTGSDFREGDQPYCFTTCDPAGNQRIWLWRVEPTTRRVLVDLDDVAELRHVVRSHRIILHNAKFDLTSLITVGVISDPSDIVWEDTMLLSHVFDSSERHDLKTLSNKYFKFSNEDEQTLTKLTIKARKIAKKVGWLQSSYVKADGWMLREIALAVRDRRNSLGCMSNLLGDTSFDLELWERALATYALKDTQRTILLWMMYFHQLSQPSNKNLVKCYNREKELLPEVMHTESHGMTLIRSNLTTELNRYETKANYHEKRAIAASGISGFNIRSYPQMQRLLFDTWGLPGLNGRSTDEPTLKDHLKYLNDNWSFMSSPTGEHSSEWKRLTQDKYQQIRTFLEEVLAYRKQNTSRNYLKNYRNAKFELHDGTWILFPTFNQTGTKTTRFSSSNPNAQNVGKGKELLDENGQPLEVDFKLRSVFGPAPGRIWYTLDYDQLQLRIFAYASQDESLINAFISGQDFHNYVASKLFNTDSPTKLQRRIAKNVNFALIFGGGENKVDTTAGMPGAYKLFSGQFPGAHQYMKKVIRLAERMGYVNTMYGYRITVDPSRSYAGVNYIVQGTEGDIVKNAFIVISKFLRTSHPEVKLIAVIHDEFILDFPSTMPEHQCRFILQEIKGMMEDSGNQIGVVTPASCEQVPNNWSETLAVAL